MGVSAPSAAKNPICGPQFPGDQNYEPHAKLFRSPDSRIIGPGVVLIPPIRRFERGGRSEPQELADLGVDSVSV